MPLLSWQLELLIGTLLNKLTTAPQCGAEAHYLPVLHAFGPSMQVAISALFPVTQLHVCRSRFVPGQPEGCCHLSFMSLWSTAFSAIQPDLPVAVRAACFTCPDIYMHHKTTLSVLNSGGKGHKPILAFR